MRQMYDTTGLWCKKNDIFLETSGEKQAIIKSGLSNIDLATLCIKDII